MMGNVRQLCTSNGITPEMKKVSADFWSEIWEAIDKAQEAGMSVGMVVGALEVAKAAIVQAHICQDE